MKIPVNELMLCALLRAGKPIDSGALFDAVVGLGVCTGWPHDQLERLTRQSVAQRMRSLVRSGRARQCGVGVDEDNRRPVPLYAPTTPYDVAAPVPEPTMDGLPAHDGDGRTYDAMTRPQLLAVIEVSDEISAAVGRFMRDMSDIQRRARLALSGAGLELDA